MQTPQFSQADIERMRTILAQHDSQAAKSNQSFDLNNPPRVPYTHQEWPRLLYNHETRTAQSVENQDEMDAALAEGWSTEPFEAQYDAPQLSAADAAQVQRFDELLKLAINKRKS